MEGPRRQSGGRGGPSSVMKQKTEHVKKLVRGSKVLSLGKDGSHVVDTVVSTDYFNLTVLVDSCEMVPVELIVLPGMQSFQLLAYIFATSQDSTLRRARMPEACRSCPTAHKRLWLRARLGKWFLNRGMYLLSQQST